AHGGASLVGPIEETAGLAGRRDRPEVLDVKRARLGQSIAGPVRRGIIVAGDRDAGIEGATHMSIWRPRVGQYARVHARRVGSARSRIYRSVMTASAAADR